MSQVIFISKNCSGSEKVWKYLQETFWIFLQFRHWWNLRWKYSVKSPRQKVLSLAIICIAWKVSKYGVFSGLYFAAFGLNTENYGVNLRIQSECGKIRTRKNSAFGYFLRSVVTIIKTVSIMEIPLKRPVRLPHDYIL